MESDRFLDVRMDITNYCNLRCRMCYFSLESVSLNEKKFMSPEFFEKIIRQVGPISTNVMLSCGAEPLVHPQFKEIVKLAKKYAQRVGFVTNGILLTPDLADFLVDIGLDFIQFSFEGATKKTYEWYRRGADFDVFKTNITYLANKKKDCNSKKPEMIGSSVLMKGNIQDLPDIVRMAKRLGFNILTVEYMRLFDGLNMDGDSLEGDPESTRVYISKAKEVAKEEGLVFGPPADLTDEPCDSARLCRRPWTFVNIWQSGEMLPCEAWYSNKPIGDLRKNTFMEIWDGEEYKKLRNSLENQSDLNENCQQCHGWISTKAGKDQFKKISLGDGKP